MSNESGLLGTISEDSDTRATTVPDGVLRDFEKV
jgi:hypothetical protein